MLEQLDIWNFQAHKRIQIKFDPYATVLIGKTDAGKSSIMRALRWVVTNKPSAARYIRHGSTFVKVRLKFDGHVLTRIKSKKKNVYILDGQKFKAVKQVVPESIARLLNIGDVNFQKQIDGPFWFTLTAGQVSKALNEIVNLSIIDDAMAVSGKLVQTSRTRVTLCKERLTDARKAKKELQDVPKLQKLLRCAEEAKKTAKQTGAQAEELSFLMHSANEYRCAKEHATTCLVGVGTAIAIGERMLACNTRIGLLNELLDKAGENKALLTLNIPDVSKLQTLRDKLLEIESKYNDLYQLLLDSKHLEKKICQIKESYTKTEKEIHKMKGLRCPLCGSKVQTTL